ncbi:MAG: 2Fe-2S ferredoxin, partial [Mycobacterium sp.]|nr:2Fe-2S ferredoxin [Mycobacterium sp.]
MDLWSRVAARIPKDSALQVLPKIDWAQQKPTFQHAEPAIIDAALR